MRATKDELPLMLQAGPASIRGTDWEKLRVSVVSVPAGTDFGPLLQGLPHDLCPGAHWGYMLKGRLRMCYVDQQEILEAGDLFYMPPGHTGVAEEDTEFIEIASPEKHQQFLEQARRNIAAMQAAAESA